MPNRCTWIENIETLPIIDENISFKSGSGGEVLHFCMSRRTAVKVANDIIRAVTAADLADLDAAEVVPILGFARASHAA